MKLAFIAIFVSLSFAVEAQQGYIVNDMTGNFSITTILNYSSASSSFQQFKEKLLVVDFFGTWCVPCVRALPKLSALQEKYKNQINILLVSEETQAKLETFIKKQVSFIFPVVVDEERNFIKSFQPPSYPYTAIVGKDGKVMAIPSQEEMTEANIEKWLAMQNEKADVVVLQTNEKPEKVITSGNNRMTEVEASQNTLVRLSQEFMYAAKTGDEIADFISKLSRLSMDELTSIIKTDDDRKAFWINLYNAYTQVALKKNPEQYKSRGKFFGSRQFEIAGKKFSLDDIEHGILRRSKIKWSLGHFNKLFPGKTEKVLRVDRLDYRLHFALNCGAKSCPPIAFYKSESINQQLDLATKAYLMGEVEYNKETNMVKLPALLSWFRRDFGGKKKIIELFRQLSILPRDRNPKIEFKDYDWTLYLQNYKL
jgi:thiol-disulfide isomerase/thioredoxin